MTENDRSDQQHQRNKQKNFKTYNFELWREKNIYGKREAYIMNFCKWDKV